MLTVKSVTLSLCWVMAIVWRFLVTACVHPVRQRQRTAANEAGSRRPVSQGSLHPLSEGMAPWENLAQPAPAITQTQKSL